MKNVGVVGVGGISDIFLDNMINRYKNLNVVGCTARNMEHIKAKAKKYSISPMNMNEMFDSSDIDIIVNLTPAPVHYEIIKRTLLAGKHSFSEKPLALNYSEGKELMDIAQKKELRIGCSPDTFLGSGVQTAVKAVEDGIIGDVTGFTVMLNRGLDLLYEFMGFLTKPGGGIGYDYGVYALTALFSILGSADEVCGFMQTNRPQRKFFLPMNPKCGQKYTVENETIMVASIKMKNGILGSVTFNGDCVFPDKPYICIQGTKGLLYLPDPNMFGGDVIFTKGYSDLRQIRGGGDPDVILLPYNKFSNDSRGIGVAEMAFAIEKDRPHRASGELACHILELLDGVVSSCESKRYAKLESTFTKPELFLGDEILD